MSERLKVVIIGCGDMGSTHLRAYGSLPDVRVVGLADPDESRAATRAKEHGGIHVYADYREAIQDERPDVVSVCVPAFLHAEAALFALDNGRRVLCEKPIALTVEDGQRMVDAAHGKLGVVFQRRLLDVWKEVENRLPQLGAPFAYHVVDFRPIRPKRLMHSRSGNGGPVIDCCVHDIDMTMRLFGPVQTVYATGAILATGKPELRSIKDLAIDTADISLRFANGHTAHLSYCWGLPTGFHDLSRTEILGSNGMLRIGDGTLEHHMPGGRVETITGLPTNGHLAQISAFVQAVRNGAPLPAEPAEALQALRVAYAALESITSGKPIGLAH